MQLEVYADLLFLINFSMDFLCLYLTARFLRRKIRPALMTCAATAGGVYSVISLFFPFGFWAVILSDIAVCALMCALTFAAPQRSTRMFMTEIFIYLLVSMALGGIMTALFNRLNSLNLPLNSGGDSISSWLFLLLAAISGLAALRSGKLLRHMSARRPVNAEITFEGKSILLKGITDTGNILRDPASGKPVIITDAKAILPLLPSAVRQSVVDGSVVSLGSIPAKYSTRIRLIPSVSVTGSRLLLGIVPDKITIHNEHGVSEVSAIFAPVSIPSLPHGCNAIIPGELNI